MYQSLWTNVYGDVDKIAPFLAKSRSGFRKLRSYGSGPPKSGEPVGATNRVFKPNSY